jgi:pimeloyl-ACP methyl ester carboxylesterase
MGNSANFAFLHGGGQGGWIWAETLDAFALQMAGTPCRAEAFDLPGCGTKRHVDTDPLSVREVAEAFAADLAASGMKDIVLVGHSNAGTIMPIVAQTCPELIRRYVFVSCIAPAPQQSVLALMATGRNRIGGEGPAQSHLDVLQSMFCNDMAEEEIPAFHARLGEDSWPTVQSLDEDAWTYDHLADKPSTFVICMKDQALPPDWQEKFAERFYAKKRVYVDAGHQVMNTRPHALAEILRHEA